MHKDDFGDRMKEYEAAESGRKFMALAPIYARIDGRCFSAFTQGFDRPFDMRISAAMLETTKYLVEATCARIGYTQSDEISLVWLQDTYKDEVFFGGKISKMTSVLASLATVKFNHECLASNNYMHNQAVVHLPVFDCRVFQLPSRTEAANVFLWREKDATKNAISMAARHYYLPNELHGKSGSEQQEMLFKKGVNFNDYPAFFRRGTFVRRIEEPHVLTPDELDKIPVAHQPAPGALFMRSRVVKLSVPPFGKVTNREEFIFDGATPEVQSHAPGGRPCENP